MFFKLQLQELLARPVEAINNKTRQSLDTTAAIAVAVENRVGELLASSSGMYSEFKSDYGSICI